MNYSYVMGVNNVNELEKNGFKIQKYGNNYGVTFSDNQIQIFEKFICENLKNGFWNEYLGNEKVFIFKYSDGTIKKYILSSDTEELILRLCKEFANCDFESLDTMLKENKFYLEKFYNKK